MRALETTYGELLSSPAANHLISYNDPTPLPVSDLKRGSPVAVVGSGIPALAPTAVKPTAVVVDVNGSGMEAGLGFNQSVSLTGGKDSPATPAESNIPGLDGTVTVTGGISVNKKTIMILLIIAVLVGLIWYFNPGNILAR